MRTIIKSIILLFSTINCGFAQIQDGYTDKTSYRYGDTVTFYLNATYPGTYDINIYDINDQHVGTINSVNLIFNSSTNNQYWANGLGYSPTLRWPVPNWASGRYLLHTSNGEFPIPIIIKGSKTVTQGIVIVIPTNTDEAYNTDGDVNGPFGAHSFYDTDPNTGKTYPILNFLRPMQSHQHDFYDGFLKWFINAGYTNVNVNIISDADMDDYSEITNAKLLIVIGHSEYWSRLARHNFDKFVDNGSNAIILSGNTMCWQVRYNGTQIECYKELQTDPDCDSLQQTSYAWAPAPHYSTLSSIGADSHFGVFGNYGGCFGGFNGHKIISAGSPILGGLYSNGQILSFPTGEFDETLISNADSTDGHITNNGGVPILDLNALGFYRAELIGYDQSNHYYLNAYSGTGAMRYAPFMAFQKTSTSGKIMTVSSNSWCRDQCMMGSPSTINTYVEGVSDCSSTVPPTQMTVATANIQQITKNMIDLILNGSSVFSSLAPEPYSFTMKPAPTTVSYSACITNGSISILPGGVYVNSGTYMDSDYGFKVDRFDGAFEAQIIDCTTLGCTHTTRMASAESIPSTPIVENSSVNSIQIFPNPNSGNFKITVTKNNEAVVVKEIRVIDMMGKIIWENKTPSGNVFEVDISNYSQGIYYVRSINESGDIEMKKLLKQ